MKLVLRLNHFYKQHTIVTNIIPGVKGVKCKKTYIRNTIILNFLCKGPIRVPLTWKNVRKLSIKNREILKVLMTVNYIS